MRPPPPPLPRPPGARVEPTDGLVVAGKFQLQRLLRRGGMGSVWVAMHLGLEVPVAIKFMASTAVSADARARFAREAKAAAQIRSTNVVQILDYGIDGGLPYIVMELLEGEDLGTRLRRAHRMTLFDVVRVLGPVARAPLELAHSRGLVHRDLKPENVFLAREGDLEVPKILDFGIAKVTRTDADDDAGDGSTREGAIVGTPYFMSPEQARGRIDIDHRSDLWSLGVIAFRALTGDKPFVSKSMADVIVKICADPIPRVSAICPDLPPALDLFFDRALARDPNVRFQSARELHAALASLLAPAQLADPALHAAMHAPTATSPGMPVGPGSWPSGVGAGHPTPAPWGQATPPPGYASSPSYSTGPSNASWPSQGSWPVAGPPNPMQTGGTLGHATSATRAPAPAKTPWLLLGGLALVAAGSLSAGAVAFFQSRSAPAPAAGTLTPTTGAATSEPAPTVSATPPPAAVPTTSASAPIAEPADPPAPTAAPKKPAAAAAPAGTAKPKPTPTRDLGY